MPVKVKAEHLLAGSAGGVVSLVLPVKKQVVDQEVRLRMVLHAGRDDVLIRRLQPYGLTRQHMTPVFGGLFKQSDFREWFLQRLDQEKEEADSRPLSPSLHDGMVSK